MRKLFLTSIFCVFALANRVFAENPCENVSFDPTFNLTTSYGKLRYNHSYNQSKLQELGQGFGISEYGMLTAGLSLASIETEVLVNAAQKVAGMGHLCIVPVSVDIFIGFQDPTIYMSNHLMPGTCEYNLVLRHEQQHQQVNIALLEYHMPKIKHEVSANIKKVLPYLADDTADADTALSELTQEYVKLIEPYVEEFKQALLKEQGRLDNKENYLAENEICQKSVSDSIF